ncbi:MAG: chemotaxis protein CheB [Acidimicrobiia bacterium]
MTCDVVVMGSSWGGMNALTHVLAALPEGFSAPVVVAQHRHKSSKEGLLASLLVPVCKCPVLDADDKQAIEPGHVYIAPADYHLIVERGHLELSVDEPVAYSRPSIDVLFESAADAYGSGVVAVVLTGANADGADGVRRVRERGGVTVAQAPETAERPEMPEAAIATGAVMHVLALDDIGHFLGSICTEAGQR